MKVDYQHPDYQAFKPRWDLVDDVAGGPWVMNKKAAEYLFKISDFPSPTTQQIEMSNKRNAIYREGARFTGFTGSTVTGFVGLAFMREPELSVPAALMELIDNIDGSGVTLEQQAKSAMAECIKNSRFFLWVDYPSNANQLSKAEQDKLNIRPVINKLDAKDVINWRVEQRGGVKQLTLAVIPELYVTEDDGFEQKTAPQWRVLRMRDNAYHVEIYRKNQQGQFVLVEDVIPTDGSGKAWEYMPATFCGSVNNDATPDEPMMEEIAHLNIGHFRNSADLELSSFEMRPTVAVKMSQHWYEKVIDKQITMGGAIALPEDGGIEIVQANPNDLALKLKDDKKSDMIALCARIIEPQRTQRTATEATGDMIQYTSRLSSAADNLSAAYTFALNCVARFMNMAQDCVYKLNTDYNTNAMTAQERQQLITEWLQGAVSDYDYWRIMTAQGQITEEFDEWQAMKEAKQPSGVVGGTVTDEGTIS